MAGENNVKNDTVGLFLRAMVDREPGKRKVKPSKAALIDLAELDLGESSDDSDFNVDEAKLKDDDDISINSDPDDDYDDDDDDEDDDFDEDDDDINENEVSSLVGKAKTGLTVEELLTIAQDKQAQALEQGITRPKILVCAICLGDYSDDSNEIVTCDGCHVSVHEGCYGISDTISVSSTVSSSSTEPWFCDACKAGVSDPPCELCPNLGYTIFKETEIGRWVHLVCALYVPGIAFSEVDKLAFPTLFEMPYSRYGAKTCSLCDDERYSKTGVCIGCDAGMCRSYFHVTCAQREGLLSEVNHGEADQADLYYTDRGDEPPIHCLISAQREGLLSEVNHGEADQADPYYAHCKLHTDRELIRKRKRNWLALQLHMKQGEMIKSEESQKTQDRLQRKLIKYREKYTFAKSNRPAPWFPTQKMPRSLSTCASFFRSLLHKTKLMGIETESHVPDSQSLGEVRRKWHVAPAFNVEFISYYLDRTSRLQEMKSKLESLLKENDQLMKEEAALRAKYNLVEKENKGIQRENTSLINKALEIHDHLKGLAGRPLRLPPAVASLHNPPYVHLEPLPQNGAVGIEKRLITKAAAKMISYSLPSSTAGGSKSSTPVKSVSSSSHNSCSLASSDVMSIHPCSVCRSTKDQHLQIQCDTCINYYHLSCLDPPLTRMPKKTKQMGWQCSDCCKSSDSEKAPEIDPAAPRQLRRIIKEPIKFSPSVVVKDQKVVVYDRSSDVSESPLKGTAKSKSEPKSSVQSSQAKVKKEVKSPKSGVKRRQSADGKRGKKKIRRRSSDVIKKGSFISNTPLDMSAESLPSASSLNSPHSESFPSADDDPLSPKKERRHRDGGKKKKKDKVKEVDGTRKKKKHHHRDKHGLGEMASELVSHFRIKIKPLPPRPNETDVTSAATVGGSRGQSSSDMSAPHTTSTTTAPPGYPPLPPGYTLTQPVMVTSTSPSASPASTNSLAEFTCSRSNNTNSAPMTSTVGGSQRSNVGRRKSDTGAEQFSKCDVCGETGGVTNTVMCDECLKAYHFNCLDPPLKKSPKRRGYSWFCEDCDKAATNSSESK